MAAEWRRWFWVRDYRKGRLWNESVHMASERFSVEAMARKYYVYKYMWEAAVGKEPCFCVAGIVDGTSLVSAPVAPWGSGSF